MLFFSSPARADDAEARLVYRQYLDHTIAGLDRLRGPSGLPIDAVLVGADGSLRARSPGSEPTSPSNIGLDLLVQIDLLDRAESAARARLNIDRVMETLGKLSRHPTNGLFFSWYPVSGTGVSRRDVSSIDNLHLALALWAVAKRLPGSATAAAAQAIFSRMDFSPFVDATKGVLGGNLRFVGNDQWKLDEYRYDYFGSETRSLYALGAAIGLGGTSPQFHLAAIPKLTFEVASPYGRRILRTWDGGTFQLFLPNLLLGEDKYSREMSESFAAYGEFVRREGARRGLLLPAAHSACAIDLEPLYEDPNAGPSLLDPNPAEVRVIYEGQAGSRAIGNKQVAQAFDDGAIPMHAVLMAATTEPLSFALKVRRVVAHYARQPIPLFRDNLGFVDGFRVRDSRYIGLGRDRAIPVVLALDKELEALALLRLLSPDGLTASARLLRADATARGMLERFYVAVDKRLSQVTARN